MNHRDTKGITVVSVILVVLGILSVGGGIWYFSQSPLRPKVVAGGNEGVKMDQGTLPSSQIPMAGWRKYEENQFIFYYPEKLKSEGDTLGDGVLSHKIFYSTDKKNPEITLLISKLDGNSVNQLDSLKRSHEYEDITINSLNGIRWLSADKTIEIITLVSGENIYQIGISAQSKIRSQDLFPGAVFTGKPYKIDIAPKDVSQIQVGRASDAAKRSEMERLGLALSFYYDQHHFFPPSLDVLIQDSSVLGKLVFKQEYLYATDSQGKSIHFGIQLGDGDDSGNKYILASDADFDSKQLGWQSGFSGADPIYDIKIIK